MQIFSIYKATNLTNGKKYIGFTNNKLHKRIIVHKWEALSNNSNKIFHKAIRKYGWNNFQWEIICQSLDGDYLLKEMETYFIDHYNSLVPYGYNMTKGGNGCLGHKHSKKTKQKISQKQKGRPSFHKGSNLSEEHKKKISESNKNKKKGPHTLERKQKLSEANKGKKRKEIICPHCNKIGGEGSMNRWHLDNCKFKNETHN